MKKGILAFLFFIVLAFSFVNAGTFSSYTSNYQSSSPTMGLNNYYGSTLKDYWPVLSSLQNNECDSLSTDFIVAIPPGGCDPTVVRSDLLAEQNVPVFCKLSAIRVNPLIESSTISSISFGGTLPEGVAGISYHPADSAINNYNTLLSDPIEEDIGSVVITLKQQPDEDNLEEYISGILTATIRYKSTLAYGTGSTTMYLKDLSDNEWEKSFNQYSFWANKGYLRATSIDGNSAKVDMYLDKDNIYSSVYLTEGQTSSTFYYPGYYCTAGFQLKLEDIQAREDMALIYVDDNAYWVTSNTGQIGDTGCRVNKLNVLPGGSGSLLISCMGESFELSIGDRGVNLTNSTGSAKIMHIGDYIMQNDKRYYLGYIGEDKETPSESYVVLFNESVSSDLNLINSVFSGKKYNEQNKELESLVGSNGKKLFLEKYKVIKMGDKAWNITFNSLSSSSEEKVETLNDVYKTNFTEGTNAVLNLTNLYPLEKKGNGEYWGEEALFEQIKIARYLKDTSSLISLSKAFFETYPSSKLYQSVMQMQSEAGIKDFSNSYKSIIVNNEFHDFYVNDFVSGQDYNNYVLLRVNRRDTNFSKNRIYDKNGDLWESVDKNGVEQLRVKEIGADYAKIDYVYGEDSKKTHSLIIKEGEIGTLAPGTDYSLDIKVKETSVEKVAKITLIPQINNDVSESNFSFSISVEKRTIGLTPEKAKEEAQDLDKTLSILRNASSVLEKTVTVGNELCTAVTAGFTISNFIGGLNGEATARTIVNNYYKDFCSQREAEKYTILDCYDNESVEEVVEEVKTAISNVNEFITSVRGENSVSGIKDFFSSLLGKDLADLTLEMVTKEKPTFSSNSLEIDGVKVSFGILTDADQIRAALLYNELNCTNNDESKACVVAKKYLKNELSSLIDDQLRKNLFDELGIKSDEYVSVKSKDGSIDVSKVPVGAGGNIKEVPLEGGSSYKVIGYNGDNYLAVLNSEDLSVENYYKYNVSSKNFDPIAIDSFSFKFREPLSNKENNLCGSSYKNPKVKYYTSGYAEGKPAVVPLSIEEGVYATVPATISLGYDDSGYVNFVYICNTGKDGVMNKASGDDQCVGIDSSNPTYSSFCGHKSGEVESYYKKAVSLIKTAQKNPYKNLIVDGQVIYSENVSGTDELDCLDYMSAKQCRILFNVCDPFVCPSSRCDFGGDYPVDDVTATGIFGSLLLCSKNSDVIFPVCVTGIYAGVENLISVLESYQSCLNTRAETGEYVGACDSIYSLYLCDMFWDAIPFFWKGALPNLVDSNKDSSGGGEYLVGADSLKNVEQSLGYFTNYYADNVFDSFKIENNIQINASVCDIDSFVGNGSVSSNLFSDIISDFFEPDAPAQTYAYFSESTYTTRTNPPTSQYKVYYQVFAGNEFNKIKYSVYLKNPAANYQFILPEYVLLKTGVLSEGESASETLDFTAPSGYKELCVSLNEKEYCGFGSASSSFASDYLSDKYAISQASNNKITTALGCQSTSVSFDDLSSVYDLYSSGSSSSDISSYGITRVCASTNPGSTSTGDTDYCTGKGDTSCGEGYECTNPNGGDVYVCYNESRGGVKTSGVWEDVGYCGVESIRCWLDKSSVDKVLNVLSLDELEEKLGSTSNIKALEKLYKSVNEELNDILDKIGKLDVGSMDVTEAHYLIKKLENISGVSDDATLVGKGNNEQKAKALAYEANIYRLLIESSKMNNVDLRVQGSTSNGGDMQGLPEVPLIDEDLDLPEIVTLDDFELDGSLDSDNYLIINDVLYKFEAFDEEGQFLVVTRKGETENYCFTVSELDGKKVYHEKGCYDEVNFVVDEEPVVDESSIYTVKSGDTLSEIASDNGLSLSQLLQLNPEYKTHPDKISPGDKIVLPQKELVADSSSETKSFDDFLSSLAFMESSGRWDNTKNSNYMGLYQIGEGVLKDVTFRSNGDKDFENIRDITVKRFIKDPTIFPVDLQNKVMLQHLANDKYYLRGSLDKVGEVIPKEEIEILRCPNGQFTNSQDIKITLSGILAASHLVGSTSFSNYLKDIEGLSAPVDGNGVSSLCYLKEFGGYDLNLGEYENAKYRVSEKELGVNLFNKIKIDGVDCTFLGFDYGAQKVKAICDKVSGYWEVIVYSAGIIDSFKYLN